MASDKYVQLIGIGPVNGLDANSADEFVAPGDGVAMSNASPNRVAHGLSTELGRQNLVTFTNFSGYTPQAIVPYVNTGVDQQYLVYLDNSTLTGPNIVLYDPATQAQPIGAITGTAANGFNQGVQFYNTLYLNSGQQYSAANPNNLYNWQQQPPNGTVQGYSVSSVSGSLPAATYYYAFTFVTQIPNVTATQETTPYGAIPLQGPPPPATVYQYAFTSNGAQNAVISGTFTGTFLDGSTYTTNLYRQSTNVPVWTLVTNLTTNTPYTDSNTDQQIAANQQLLLNQDPPPLSSLNEGAIFIHQERIWVFSSVFSGPFAIPQTQLAYSDLGTPWRFNNLAQEAGGSTLLVGNSASTAGRQYVGYGDNPVAGASMGGIALLFKSRQTFLLTGSDPDEFFVQRAFDIGCISRRSVITALGQVWWLSESGAYTFGGSGPQYLSDKIRRALRNIPYDDKLNAVSWFKNLTWGISFPATGITYCFYTPTQTWYMLPYATNCAASVPANPATFQGSLTTAVGDTNELVCGRPGQNALDWWLVGENDLGAPLTATWTGPLTSSGAPHVEKNYDFITVLAPFQPGTVTATLTIDPGSTPAKVHTATFNLASTGTQPETRHIVRIAPDLRGYLAQLSLSYTNTVGQTTPLVIYRADVWGTFDRALVLPV